MNAATSLDPAETTTSRPVRGPGLARRLALMLSVPVVLAAGAGWWWMAGSGREVTQNAALHMARLSIAPSVGGRVTEVAMRELQPVRAGDLLFAIDAEPYHIAVAEREAALQAAQIQVAQMKAALAGAEAAAALAHADAAYMEAELARQGSLNDRGVASASKLDDARHNALMAADRAQVADRAVATARAALGEAPEAPAEAHPTVRAAAAALARARYDLERTRVIAPADGVVYQSTGVRTGTMVAPGQPLFALVETSDLWVEANFKETQLTRMAPGQTARVTLDVVPGHSFTGQIEAIGAGTGAEFALLPAQNATGNWVKVTQRVPVRIRLDVPADLAGLASGLSAEVTVETGEVRRLPGFLAATAVGG